MDELYQRIIESYKETGSVKKTAEDLGTYPIKVRRVLITEGLWKSKTSEQIADLLEQGKTVAEIAEELVISEKNVQSYMPYSRGQYGGEDRSNEAIRSEEYRERKQVAAKKQVTNTEARSQKKSGDAQEQNRVMEELRVEKERLLKETERLLQEKKEIWDMIEAEMKRVPMAVQLHLELDIGYFDEEHREVLRRYGRMKEGITRDFIVPGTMTLHGLHYAIMKAFGWQNGHLHSFIPYEDEFKKMTGGGLVKEWTRLVGMYFRFLSEDYEDIYWDDDYDENESVKSWLKSKYCGPYCYGGVGEHYIPAQIEVDQFRKEYPNIQKKSTDQRKWGVYFDGKCEELLERLMIWTVLKTPADQRDWDTWKTEKETSLKRIERERKQAIKRYKKLLQEMERIFEEAGSYMDKDGISTRDILPYLKKMDEMDHELNKLCNDYNPEPIPALSALCYRYDYGDGWEIKITCTNAWYDRSVYARDEDGNMRRDKKGFVAETVTVVDAYEQPVEGAFLDKLREIEKKEKPVCTDWDGMSLVDDVGGVGGFCRFLEIINGADQEEKKYYKTWARGLGWTGRMPKPENML